jgi:glutathione S-transferase
MTTLILHHYAGSPFSEKVRLIFGYKRIAWQSVDVPSLLPKPDVMALTGGYRRTPFMQIGADIFCDTALMCRVIDALAPEPPLYPAPLQGLADIVAQWADSSFFWTAVPYTLQPIAIPHMFPGATPESMKAFGADRAAMNPNLRRASVTDGRAHLDAYLERLTQLLGDGRPFLLGALPTIADFSVAQSIWFIHRAPPVATVLEPHTALAAWYQRMKAFGHGTRSELSSAEAIAIAAAATPVETRVEPGTDLAAGEAVTVTPTDYAHDPVAGALVGLSRDEVVVSREDPRAGTVHVHFPRLGFQIRKQTA